MLIFAGPTCGKSWLIDNLALHVPWYDSDNDMKAMPYWESKPWRLPLDQQPGDYRAHQERVIARAVSWAADPGILAVTNLNVDPIWQVADLRVWRSSGKDVFDALVRRDPDLQKTQDIDLRRTESWYAGVLARRDRLKLDIIQLRPTQHLADVLPTSISSLLRRKSDEAPRWQSIRPQPNRGV